MQDEYLTRCVVDPVKRTIYLYSSEGDEKQVTCETVDEFMNVLEFVRATVDEETLSYANPLQFPFLGEKIPGKIFTHDTFFKMNPYRINYKALKQEPVKTTPENVKEANENLFRAKWNLPQAAKHCGMSHKEMKLTFWEYLKYNPITYKA